MPKSWRLLGWLAAGLFLIFVGLTWPARADVNPWLRDVAASGQGAEAPAYRVASRHSHRIRVKFRMRQTPAAPTDGMLRGVNFELASRAREIVAACGSRVTSGVRRTRVAGSGRLSLHASGRAVDLVGNPGCIYAHLRSWPGGASTDYARVHHVHVSLGGSEDGRRFAHHRVPRRTRYAAR